MFEGNVLTALIDRLQAVFLKRLEIIGTDAPVLSIDIPNRRVGINTVAPSSALTLYDENNLAVDLFESSNVDGAVVRQRRSRGTIAAPAQVAANDRLGGIVTYGYTNAAAYSPASGAISFTAQESFTAATHATAILFSTIETGNAGGNVERIRISPPGALLVGKTSAAGTDAAGNAEVAGTLRAGALNQIVPTIAATATPATTGTMTVPMTSSVITITPSGACTFNASGGVAGDTAVFVITTSGASSFTLTWNTGYKTTGTLATGTTTAKTFTVSFAFNGATWCECSRTAAM